MTNIDIRVRNIKLSEALRNYVEQRLERSLRRFENRVRHVTVWLADINGPRGGVDKSCIIDATLRPLGRIVLENRSGDLYAAIDLAAGRLRRSLSRTLKRAREQRRSRESVRVHGQSRSLSASKGKSARPVMTAQPSGINGSRASEEWPNQGRFINTNDTINTFYFSHHDSDAKLDL